MRSYAHFPATDPSQTEERAAWIKIEAAGGKDDVDASSPPLARPLQRPLPSARRLPPPTTIPRRLPPRSALARPSLRFPLRSRMKRHPAWSSRGFALPVRFVLDLGGSLRLGLGSALLGGSLLGVVVAGCKSWSSIRAVCSFSFGKRRRELPAYFFRYIWRQEEKRTYM